jgi:Fuc2NAc and GlcNAc transferase
VGPDVLLVALAALVSSVVLTGIVRSLVVSHGVLDVPNARSSHTAPTPRGGGVSIVVVTTIAVGVLATQGYLDFNLSLALGGGLAIAVVGFIDDRRSVSAKVRLVVHFAAAFWALAWLGGLPPLRLGEHVFTFGWGGYVLGAVGIVWTLNLFNFMDGIDGLAASEAIFIALGAMLLSVIAGTTEVMPAAAAFAAACAGFLFWNLPRARIFMGDVGSGYVGYAIVTMALAAARHDSVALLVWLILGAVFFVDATVTLVRRLARGERVQEAHRSHAYQWLARKWQSHGRVTGAVTMLNVVWLLPIALIAARHPSCAGWLTLGALLPIAVMALGVGAGRKG